VNRLPHQAASMLFPKPYTSTSTFCGHYFKPPLLLFPFRRFPFHSVMSEGRAAEVLKPASGTVEGVFAAHSSSRNYVLACPHSQRVSDTCWCSADARRQQQRTPDAMQPNRQVELSPCASQWGRWLALWAVSVGGICWTL